MSQEDELRAELARARGELLAVLAINQTLRASRDLITLYRVLTDQLSSLVRFDSLFIALYLPETDRVRFEYSIDEGVVDDVIVERMLDETPLNARIIRGRRPLLIDDLDQDPARRSGKMIPFGQVEKRSRAWLGVPMISGNEVQGVLSVQSYRPNAFGDADIDLLMLVSSQIAVAIQNARLFRRLRRTIAELSTPLIPVAAGVLVLPLIGTIDPERAQRTTEQVLNAIVTRQAETLLIDVTGVAKIDAFVVDQLLKIIRATALLGARSSIVGISAELAQTFVMLEFDPRGLQTFSDLQSALSEILAKNYHYYKPDRADSNF
jgi:anti-anti-sigma regulatory factor